MKKQLHILTVLFLLALCAPKGSRAQEPPVSSSNVTISDEVSIFPNPAKENKFTVQSRELIISIDVMNVLGHSLLKRSNPKLSKEPIVVDVLGVEKGLYLIKIELINKRTIIRKLFIK